ncbi:MAG: hypothetical protein RL022_2756, partial [Chloroflexota bacterium]
MKHAKSLHSPEENTMRKKVTIVGAGNVGVS